MDPREEVEVELFPFLRVYKDGRVEKIHTPRLVPASLHSPSAVSTRDVDITPHSRVSVRLFLPQPPPPAGKRLPILFYVHGGGFCIESARSANYTAFLNTLTAAAGVLGVSVEYRLAPEYPVPTSHLDSWAALQWVARQEGASANTDSWITDHGDFSRIFLAGDSAGGNICHHLAMAASGAPVIELPPTDDIPLTIVGLILIHPYFAGWTPVEDEFINKRREESAAMWRLTCPSATAGIYDPLVNLCADGAPSISRLRCRHVLVFAAGKDYLRDRALLYCDMLSRSGWDGVAELEEHVDEDHVFHLMKPNCYNAGTLIGRIVKFINNN